MARDSGVRDEGLGAVEDVVPAVAPGRQSHRAQIRAGVRFRNRERADARSIHDARQVAPLQIAGAGERDRIRAEAVDGEHRIREAGREGKAFARQAERSELQRRRIHVRVGRREKPQQTGARKDREHLPRDGVHVAGVRVGGPRRDLRGEQFDVRRQRRMTFFEKRQVARCHRPSKRGARLAVRAA